MERRPQVPASPGSRRSCSACRIILCPPRSGRTSARSRSTPTSSAGPCGTSSSAWPHRDEDFVVPKVDQRGLRALLEPHGRVEDMDVHGQLVGVRLYPNDRSIRTLAPAGIELTPPRAERSTGPGHRDFTIVSDPSISLEEDMARRDFTINAMARRLEDGMLLDPFGGAERPRALARSGPSPQPASARIRFGSFGRSASSRSSISSSHPRRWSR